MAKYARFTESDAKRVAQVTRYVERVSRNDPKIGKKPRNLPYGFFAKITGTDGSGKYSWQALEPQATSHDMTGNDEWGHGSHTDGTNYAIESEGSKYVLKDSVVWLEGARNKDCFIFDYGPGLVTGTSDGTIGTRSGSTPGTGNVIVDSFDIATESFDGTRDSIKVFSPFTQEVPDGKYVELTYGQGVWWVSGADCGDDDGTGGS